MINYIRLANFGQFKSLHISSAGPVVGLLGPNGSGKSTVMAALKFAIKGETDDNIGTYIRNLNPDEKAVVECGFTKQGMDGTIKRAIGKTNSRELHWNGEVIKTSEGVNATMGDIWGVTSKSQLFGVFIAQGELDKLLFGDKAEREALFVKLVGLGHCDAVVSKIDGMIAMRRVDATDYRPLIDQLRETIQTNKADMAVIDDKLAQLPDMAHLPAMRTRLQLAASTVETNTTSLADIGRRQTVAGESQAAKLKTLNIASADVVHAQVKQLETDAVVIQKHKDASTARKQSLGVVIDCAARQAASAARVQMLPVITEDTVAAATSELAATKQQIEHVLNCGITLADLVAKKEDLVQVQTDLDGHRAYAFGLVAPVNYDARRRSLTDTVALATLSCTLVEQRLKAHVHTDACPACGSKTPDPDFCTPENLVHLRKNLQVSTEDLRQLELEMTTFTKQHESVQQKIALCTASIERLQAAIAANTFETHLAQVRADILPPAVNAMPRDRKLVDALRDVLRQLHTTRDEMEQKLRNLMTGRELLQSARNDNEALSRQLSHLIDHVGVQPANAQGELDATSAQIQTLDEQLQQNRQGLTSWREWARALDQDAATLKALESQHAFATTALAKAQQDYASALAQVQQDPLAKVWLFTPDGQLVSDTTELQNRIQERDNLTGSRETIVRALSTMAVKMGELEAQQKKTETALDVIRQLQLLRNIFERKGLPLMYVKYRFKQLAEITSANLAAMDANFAVRVDPDTSVSFTFSRLDIPEATTLPQFKLSGGQRVRLAVAFLLAVQQLIYPDVGLLCLDEPTTHLDHASQESLRDLLESMAVRLRNADTQLWVADHSEVLQTAFTHVVNLATDGVR